MNEPTEHPITAVVAGQRGLAREKRERLKKLKTRRFFSGRWLHFFLRLQLLRTIACCCSRKTHAFQAEFQSS